MAVYNFNASDSTHIDQNLTDFEGSADANGFSLYVPTNLVYNPATNATTVTYSYMLHERTNNFSAYSCTTYAQYKIGTAAYVKSYNPATTIQYTAMTTNRYYWMGNNDGSPAIAFTSIPTTGTITSPTASAWSFTVNHDINGTAPAVLINAYIDSNTNATYVPVGTTITATLTTNLNSATTNLNLVSPYFTTAFSAAPTVTRSNNGSTMAITPSNAVVTNTSANNAVTYTYQYSLDGTTWTGNTTSAAGWTGISVSPTTQYSVYVRCLANSNSISTSAGPTASPAVPTAATGLSASESSTQSRDVTISWTPGAANGSAITAQTLVWGTDSTLATGTTQQFFDGTTSSYTILNNRSTGALFPSTTYYYKITMSNAVGDNGTAIYSFTPRASSPFISPSANTVPNTRSSTKVWNGTSMVQAQVRVYDGTTPYDIAGWKYLK